MAERSGDFIVLFAWIDELMWLKLPMNLTMGKNGMCSKILFILYCCLWDYKVVATFVCLCSLQFIAVNACWEHAITPIGQLKSGKGLNRQMNLIFVYIMGIYTFLWDVCERITFLPGCTVGRKPADCDSVMVW